MFHRSRRPGARGQHGQDRLNGFAYSGECKTEKNEKFPGMQMMGKPSKTRTTVTTKGKNQLDLAFDVQGDGGWAPMGTENCTKGGG